MATAGPAALNCELSNMDQPMSAWEPSFDELNNNNNNSSSSSSNYPSHFMSLMQDFTNEPYPEEYFDSDESPLPSGPDVMDDVGDVFIPLSPSDALPMSQVNLYTSSRNSLADSGSSNGPASTTVTSTSLRNHKDDSVLDGSEIKPEWKTEQTVDGRNGLDGPSFGGAMEPHSDFSSPNSAGYETAQQLSPQTSQADSLMFGNNNMYMPFDFKQTTSDMSLETSRETSPFSPRMPNPQSPQYYHGIPTNTYPPWHPIGMGVNQQMVPVPSQFSGNVGPPLNFNRGLFTQPQPFKLTVDPTPTKSRVETQIPIKLNLTPLPPGIKRIHLPTHTISKPKLLAKPTPEPSPDMLELHVRLVCTSAMQNKDLMKTAMEQARKASKVPRVKPTLPSLQSGDGSDEGPKPQDGGEVTICQNCVSRERKRASRKKIKKVEDEEIWRQDELYRVIVFNTGEVREWEAPKGETDESGQLQVHMVQPGAPWTVEAPMRIACYCRHHTEKLGFQVIFTLTDFRGEFVAQALSPSIMITDDHKTPHAAENALNRQAAVESTVFYPSPPLTNAADRRSSSMSTQLPDQPIQASRLLVRPAPAGPLPGQQPSKKRKQAAARLETALSPVAQLPSTVGPSASSTPSPHYRHMPPAHLGLPPDGMFVSPTGTMAPGQLQMSPGHASGPPTPNHNQPSLFNPNGTANLDNGGAGLYSGTSSLHQSRAPSPTTSMATLTMPAARGGVALSQVAPRNVYASGPANAASNAASQTPVIHKVVPQEGLVLGGYEVTVLGKGFKRGVEVMFGGKPATTTTFWGPESLVCLVPPAESPGAVRITFKDAQLELQGHPVWFTYKDDCDQQAVNLALAILNSKMNGGSGGLYGFAQQIIGRHQESQDSFGAGGGMTGGDGSYTGRPTGANLDGQLLNVLEMIDLDDSPHSARFNLRTRATGQTALHVACYLGLHRFVAGLLARGANPDVRDKAGYTALHMASLKNRPDIIRLLTSHGADSTLRTLSGLTAADVAKSPAAIRAINRFESHTRSRSGVSLHSRVNSALNLAKALPAPESKDAESDNSLKVEADDGEESPEYSTFATTEESDAASENADEEDEWLDMRENNSITPAPPADDAPRRQRRGTDGLGGLALPTAAMTAFRDHMTTQFQQLQQAMQLNILQNLPMPYIPQMPDYQAAVMQRLASMVPNLGGPRPDSNVEDVSSIKELWHALSSMATSAQPAPIQAPPAYSEIFQQDTYDKKQSSAVQAAAEAEADVKCAALYDEAGPSTQEALTVTAPVVDAEEQFSDEDAAFIEIGPKNAITEAQRERILRARAERMKRLSGDRNLFFIWIPLLVLMMCAMFYSSLPYWGSTIREVITNVRVPQGAVLGQLV